MDSNVRKTIRKLREKESGNMDLETIREKIADGDLNQLEAKHLVAAIITDEPDEYPEAAKEAWEIIQKHVLSRSHSSTGLTNNEYAKLYQELDDITGQGKAKVGRVLAAIELFKSLC